MLEGWPHKKFGAEARLFVMINSTIDGSDFEQTTKSNVWTQKNVFVKNGNTCFGLNEQISANQFRIAP